jgi:fimbrial isopeptide formation D2 family protein/LPXTG-motif cell wall-anchored protein
MKKNVLKKFAAAALAAAIVMSSMSVMAFAAEASTGSVTITKYMSDTGVGETLSPEDYTGDKPTGKDTDLLQNVEFAYVEVGERVQVDTAASNSSQTEIKYNVTNDEFLNAIGIKKNADNNYTQTELNNAIRLKKTETIAFVKDKAIDANKKSTAATSGDVKFDNLSLHKLYVFAETDATKAALASDENKKVNVTKVSVPFLVSLPFTGKDGKTVTDLKVYPKNSTGTATIEKKIVEDSAEKDTTVANIGDTIKYKVTYSIPVGENGLESLVVTDTMSKGLTFDTNNIEVKNEDVVVSADNYTVESKQNPNGNGSTITTITFTEKYCKSLEKNTTQNFTITYTATLNKDAVLGQSGNTNAVSVTYKNTGDVDRKTEPTGTPKVFTYGIDLLKKGEGVDKLVGVKFTLTDENGKGVNVEKNDSNNFYTPGGRSNTVTTGDDGKIYIRGLKPGTYKLTETKTNNGYVLLKNPVVIVITQTSAETGAATATVGSKDDVTMTADNGSATAIVPLTVVNSKGFDLPVTGGRGIALFTIAGIAIVVAAGTLLFMRKRSK